MYFFGGIQSDIWCKFFFLQIHQILENVTIFTGELNQTGTRRLQPSTSTQFNLNNKFLFGANYLGWTFTSRMLFVSFLYVATDWHKLASRDAKRKKNNVILQIKITKQCEHFGDKLWFFSHWTRRLSLHCTNVRAILDPDCSRKMWMVIYGVVDYVKYMCSEFVATHNTMTRSISIYNRWLTKFHSIRLAALFFVYRFTEQQFLQTPFLWLFSEIFFPAIFFHAVFFPVSFFHVSFFPATFFPPTFSPSPCFNVFLFKNTCVFFAHYWSGISANK